MSTEPRQRLTFDQMSCCVAVAYLSGLQCWCSCSSICSTVQSVSLLYMDLTCSLLRDRMPFYRQHEIREF